MGAADGSIFSRNSLTVGSQQVYYLKGGREGGMEPLVYLHGLGGGGKWESFHMALGTATMTYALHLPGFQDGAPPEGITSVRDYADLVTAFMDAEGLDRVILMGHSIGGWAALDLAVRNPERIARLALVDAMGVAAPDAPPAGLESLDEEEFVAAVFAKVGMVARPQVSGFGATWENVRTGPEFQRQWRGRNLLVGLTGGQCYDPALGGEAADITADTLLIWGRLDGIVPPAHGEFLRRVIPKSNLHVIEGSGHLPMSEKPETFNRIVRDFLLGIKEDIPDVVTG
jgi:2-hydroxy-6-oxonona-2,4-dienedioate hydrolase